MSFPPFQMNFGCPLLSRQNDCIQERGSNCFRLCIEKKVWQIKHLRKIFKKTNVIGREKTKNFS